MAEVVSKIFLLVLILADLFILVFTILQVANGLPTPHIPFWDSQIRTVIGFLTPLQ